MIRFNPVTLKRIKRFRSIKRGYYSFVLFVLVTLFAFFAEFFINSKALVVNYQGQWFFPVVSSVYSGETFGLDYKYEANYRDLKKKLVQDNSGFVLMPLVPYNPYENDLPDGVYPPSAPDVASEHYLGTDTTGRDVLARLVYGYRIAIIFSLSLLICNYLVGVSIGCAMGYFGGMFDLVLQRVIEIWSNIPFLYIIMIVVSIMTANVYVLIGIMVFFGWMNMTWYMRTVTYKEKAREYVMAARALGATHRRIVFKHILPNTVSLIVTFIPFSISAGIVALTSLDYLGFGLPAPTPSWGELLRQGTNNIEKRWIAVSVVTSMTVVLVMVTFIGEAIREAFDPKKHTTYQ